MMWKTSLRFKHLHKRAQWITYKQTNAETNKQKNGFHFNIISFFARLLSMQFIFSAASTEACYNAIINVRVRISVGCTTASSVCFTLESTVGGSNVLQRDEEMKLTSTFDIQIKRLTSIEHTSATTLCQ